MTLVDQTVGVWGRGGSRGPWQATPSPTVTASGEAGGRPPAGQSRPFPRWTAASRWGLPRGGVVGGKEWAPREVPASPRNLPQGRRGCPRSWAVSSFPYGWEEGRHVPWGSLGERLAVCSCSFSGGGSVFGYAGGGACSDQKLGGKGVHLPRATWKPLATQLVV